MDKCLYMQQITNDYWYCDHEYAEREWPDCSGCSHVKTIRMIREEKWRKEQSVNAEEKSMNCLDAEK
jgi:hypothetical protein